MQALLNTISRRPLVALVCGLALGVAPLWHGHAALVAMALAAGLLFLTAGLFFWIRGASPLVAGLFLLSGLALGFWRSQGLVRSLNDTREFYAAAVQLDGTVIEDLGEKEETGRRSLRVRNARWQRIEGGMPDEAWQGDVRLSYTPIQGETRPGPGDRIRAWGTLRRPPEPMNPGEFDYRRYLIGRGMTGLFSVRQGLPPEITEKAEGLNLMRLAWHSRNWLSDGLKARLNERQADLARGMVLGDTGGLSSRDMSVYSRTGLVHILSVSGLHMALALAIFIWIGRRAGMSRRALAWMALLGAIAYAMVCGMPVPCQRALFLFGLALLARALDLESDLVNSLAFGAAVILLEQPGALFEAGCQLSFVVSLCLVLLTPAISERLPDTWPRWLKIGLAGTAAAELGSIPLVAWHFSVFSWPSLFASVVTAPLMGPIVGLGLGTAALGAWLPFAGLLEWCLKILDGISGYAAALPYAAYSVGDPSLFWLLGWAALIWAIVSMQRAIWIWPGLVLLSGWLLWPGLPWAHQHPGLTKTWFLAVGQGDSSITRFEDGAVLLVDAGPMRPDAGSWTVGPALRHLGINRIDWAVVTHPHADHYGGMFWVLEQFKVGSLLHSGEESESRAWHALKQEAARHSVAMHDLSADPPPPEWQGRIETLSPLKPRISRSRHDMHNNNVVLNIGGWLLLMGDMQKEGEARLLRLGRIKAGQLLKSGHHGSSTSTTPALLKAFKPEAVLISCAAHNRYRHPSPKVLESLRGPKLFRTDLNGCVMAEHSSKGTRFVPWREAGEVALFKAPPKVGKSPWKKLLKQRADAQDTDAE